MSFLIHSGQGRIVVPGGEGLRFTGECRELEPERELLKKNGDTKLLSGALHL